MVDQYARGSSRSSRKHYVVIAPDVTGQAFAMRVPRNLARRPELGTPVCSTRQAGLMGWPWARRVRGSCSVPGPSARVEHLRGEFP